MKKFLAILLTSLLLVAMCVVPASAASKNVAAGADIYYISGAGAHATYTGNITDGKIAETVTYDGNWFGLGNPNKEDGTGDYVWVVIDLGELYQLTSARIHLGVAAEDGAGVGRPWDLTFSFSDDGETFVGGSEIAISGEDGVEWWNVDFEDGVWCRYLKVKGIPASWIFIDEVEAYAEVEGDVTTDDNSSSEDNSSSGSTDVATVDVLKGLDATISGSGTSNWPGSLTDGDAPADLFVGGEAGWLGLNDANHEEGSNYVWASYELAEETEILGASLTYAINKDAGVGRPYEVTLQVSNDGSTWSNVGTFDTSAEDDDIYTVELSGLSANAKYVRINGLNSGWFFLGELNVYAEGEADNDNAGSTNSGSTGNSGSTNKPSTPAAGDASNMMVFAVIALVAIAGSAVVIKTRR